jgi:hypothetical protein
MHNKGTTAKSYVFKHEPALSVSVIDIKKPTQSHKMGVRVTISPRSVSVPPNGRVEVSIDFNVFDAEMFHSTTIGGLLPVSRSQSITPDVASSLSASDSLTVKVDLILPSP